MGNAIFFKQFFKYKYLVRKGLKVVFGNVRRPFSSAHVMCQNTTFFYFGSVSLFLDFRIYSHLEKWLYPIRITDAFQQEFAEVR